ncbi:MAG: transcription antitermination factor NusB [Nocardioidaceae bacterium]
MAARSRARKRALDILFESELRSMPAGGSLADRLTDPAQQLNPYTITLVEGVGEHRERLDDLVSEYSLGWALERMPVVDRNLLRIGLFEMLYCDEVPDAVAISEAVKLARELSTDESPAFVNGILGRIAELKPTLLSPDD